MGIIPDMKLLVPFAVIVSCASGFPSAGPGPAETPSVSIVGGSEAKPNSLPYQVSLQMFVGNNQYEHFCGGSIYNAKTIITAAHCIVNLNMDVRVVAGDHTLYKTEGKEQNRGVTKQLKHPSYNSDMYPIHDIALVELDKPLTLNDAVKPVALPSSDAAAPAVGTKMTISGWGTLTYQGASPTKLQVAQVPVISDATCASQNFVEMSHMDTMICAAYANGGVDACQGDSGGPMVADGVLYGVVSWGSGCAKAGSPGVYAEVAKYRSWIMSNASC